jgi:hypothetical protein
MAEHKWLYHQVICDIDLDGNMEWIVSSSNFFVYDLVNMQIDFQDVANSERWSPIVADVTGDGFMDIVVSHGSYLIVYNKSFNQIARIPESGDLPGIKTSRYPHATDLDSDGLNEIILTRGDGTVVVIDTNGQAKFGGSRAEEKGYSMYRQSVSEFVSILVLKDEYPVRKSVNVTLNPILSVSIKNLQDESMNIFFRTNASGTWQDIGSYENVSDGVYNITAYTMDVFNRKYWWTRNKIKMFLNLYNYLMLRV